MGIPVVVFVHDCVYSSFSSRHEIVSYDRLPSCIAMHTCHCLLHAPMSVTLLVTSAVVCSGSYTVSVFTLERVVCYRVSVQVNLSELSKLGLVVVRSCASANFTPVSRLALFCSLVF